MMKKTRLWLGFITRLMALNTFFGIMLAGIFILMNHLPLDPEGIILLIGLSTGFITLIELFVVGFTISLILLMGVVMWVAGE